MNQSAYWRERFAILETVAHKQSDVYLAELEELYHQTELSVRREIESWYQRFANNNGISLSEARKQLTSGQLAEFKWTVEQYIKAGQQGNLSKEWLRKLENASARFHVSRLEAVQMQIQQQIELLYGNQVDGMDTLLRELVSNGYTSSAFEIQKGLGIGWDLTALDQAKLTAILAKPWTTDGRTFRDRCWTNKRDLVDTLHKTLIQGMLRGDTPEKTIRTIQKRFGVSRYQARRLVHTETSYFTAISKNQMYHDLSVERIEIVETLDVRTCSVCQPMDGIVIPLTQYQPGITVPPFHPNCRGTTCPHFADMEGERAARNVDGEVYYVPANMTYAEWKKTFVDGGLKTGLSVALGDAKSTPITINDCVIGVETYGLPDGYGGVKKAVDVVTYTTPDGTKFIFPKKYNKAHQTMTPEQAIECWAKVPEAIRKKAQKEIVFVDYYNPADSYWKKHYKNFTHSYATGGDSITFYRYDYPHSSDYVVRTYCHEAGHYIDSSNATNNIRFSEQPAWTTAMKNDKITSGKDSPTTYGKNAPTEDFAESVAEYQKDHLAFSQEFPERTKLLVQILK
ncbi:MAG: minor capsid protein [Butyricicoccus pullicaecorum]|nr:minor capsid protein [Butyricicoccus pullicaecorum]